MMDEEDKPVFEFMGRDVLKIPCFRTAWLYGISSYIGVGLATFLVTSRPRLASHVGFSATVVITSGFYMYCRRNYNKTKMELRHIQEALAKAAVMQGTEEAENKNLPKFENV